MCSRATHHMLRQNLPPDYFPQGEELFYEGFEEEEFPPAGWKVINDGGPNKWERVTENPISGIASARIWYNSTAHNDWLISPPIQPVDGCNALVFKAKQYSSSYIDRFNVLLSTTGNKKEDFTITLASNVGPTSTTPEVFVYDLSAYNDQTVYFAIQAISTDMYALYVDDFAMMPTNLIVTGLNKDYRLVPTSQLPNSVVFETAVQNLGAPLASNVNVVTTLKDAGGNILHTSTNVLSALNAGERKTFSTPPFDATTLAFGDYTITHSAEFATDFDPTDNTDVFNFSVNDYIFARDAGEFNETGIGYDGNIGVLGNLFEIGTPATISGVQFVWPATLDEATAPYQLALYKLDNGVNRSVTETIFTTGTFERVQSQAGETMNIAVSPRIIQPGVYALVIKQTSGNSIQIAYDKTPGGFTVQSTNITPTSLGIDRNIGNVSLRMDFTPVPKVSFNISDGTNPVAGATVTVKLGENVVGIVTSDASGAAEIGLSSGNYSYSVEAVGYFPQNDLPLTVSADMTVDVQLEFQPKVTFSISDGTNPLGYATITIRQDENAVGTLTSNASGIAEIHLSEGEYSYSVERIGYEPVNNVSLTVSSDMTEDVQLESLPPVLAFNPTTYTFPETQFDATSNLVGFWLRNNGGDTLTINPWDVTIEGGDSDQFILTPLGATAYLGAGESIGFNVAFSPNSAGEKTATIEINDNLGTIHEVAISGIGVDYTITSFPYYEPFDAEVFPPTGWINGGTGPWQRVTIGTGPECSPIGEGMLRFNSWSYGSGVQGSLITLRLDMGSGTYGVKFKMYRDPLYSGSNDRVEVYANAQGTTVGATLLGTIYRSMTQNPVVDTEGWYDYTFIIPNEFVVNPSFIILVARSGHGANIFVDEFTIDQVSMRTITQRATPSEGGTVTGGGEYPQGTTVDLIASANWGYKFVNWTDASNTEVSTSETYSYTVGSENASFTANFELLPTYTITFTVEDDLSNPVEGAAIEIYGETVTTDGAGEATIDLCNGDYGYKVSKFGHFDAENLLTVSGADLNEDVTLPLVPITSISLNPVTLSLDETLTHTVETSVQPSNASPEHIIWSSDDPSVATVDQHGMITAMAVGNATITAEYMNDPAINATCDVTVTPFVHTTKITLSPSKKTIKVRKGFTPNITFDPANATNKKISWTSNDPNIATVDNTGKIVGKKAGNTTITATTEDGNRTATCEVKVEKVSVTGVALSPTTKAIRAGEGFTLQVTFEPANATNRNVNWHSDNESVASVSGGSVQARAEGTATITVMTEEGGYKASCVVTVTQPVEEVSLDKSELSLNLGESYTLVATVSPANAANKTVSWSSSNPGIAAVEEDGKVTAMAKGIATITVTTEDGKKSAKCTVTVTNPGDDTSVDAEMLHLTLFPNPARTQVTIQGLEASAQIAIINSLGSTVLSSVIQPNEPIDISTLPAGVYLVRIDGATLRFVKE